MAGYDFTLKIKSKYASEARPFFYFLQAVGRKFVRPTRINYRYLGRGRFYVSIDGSPGGIDALLQELHLNRGLYYYSCTLSKNKREIITNVLVPIFQDLLDTRFQNSYSRHVRRHIIGKIFDEKYIPGDFHNQFSHEYEVLFRKCDIGSINDRDFIQDLDSLLTRFMLSNLNHPIGQRSPIFSNLVDQVYLKGVGMAKEVKKVFNEVHSKRTSSLHRLETNSEADIRRLAFQIYNYFQYYEEFDGSQKIKTEVLHGKRYKRIKYGNEPWKEELFKDDNEKSIFWSDITKKPCHDCAAIKGQYHCEGCDVEVCPRCKEQYLGCGCKLNSDY